MKTLFRQIDAATNSSNFWVAMYCNHLILSDTVRELTVHGYQNVSVFVWWKNNFNLESAMHVLFATEFVVMGWRRGTSGMPCHLDPNPTRRHNVFVGSQQRNFHRDSAGNIVNPYQKPAYLAYNMCKAFCEPHDTIVIVGSGAGGDIEGAVAAKMNVVTFEIDQTSARRVSGAGTKKNSKRMHSSSCSRARSRENSVPTQWSSTCPRDLSLRCMIMFKGSYRPRPKRLPALPRFALPATQSSKRRNLRRPSARSAACLSVTRVLKPY